MFVHLRFRDGKEFREEVLIFHREAIKVSYVLERMRHLYTANSIVRLYNDDGRLLKSREKVENASVYTLLRGIKC